MKQPATRPGERAADGPSMRRARDAAGATSPRSSPGSSGPSCRRILVVAAEGVYPRKLIQVLSRDGHEVEGVGQAEEALVYLERHPVELVILDLGLPERGGERLFRALRKTPTLAHLPTLFFCRGGHPLELARGFRLDPALVLKKPFTAHQLRGWSRPFLLHLDRIETLGRSQSFSGALESLDFCDLIGVLHHFSRSGRLRIVPDHGGPGADARFKDGRLVWARAAHLLGAEVLMELMLWANGAFEFQGEESLSAPVAVAAGSDADPPAAPVPGHAVPEGPVSESMVPGHPVPDSPEPDGGCVDAGEAGTEATTLAGNVSGPLWVELLESIRLMDASRVNPFPRPALELGISLPPLGPGRTPDEDAWELSLQDVVPRSSEEEALELSLEDAVPRSPDDALELSPQDALPRSSEEEALELSLQDALVKAPRRGSSTDGDSAVVHPPGDTTEDLLPAAVLSYGRGDVTEDLPGSAIVIPPPQKAPGATGRSKPSGRSRRR